MSNAVQDKPPMHTVTLTLPAATVDLMRRLARHSGQFGSVASVVRAAVDRFMVDVVPAQTKGGAR